MTDFDPGAVVIDPMSALLSAGVTGDVHAMVLRLVDFLKGRGVTALFTNLGVSGENATTEMQISSLMDVWLLLYNRESNGEHNRQLYVLKSRGMAHSNQVREFILSSEGIKLREAYVGPEGVLTGSARLAQEAKDTAAALAREQEMERRQPRTGAQAARDRRADRDPAGPAGERRGGGEHWSTAKAPRARINWPPTALPWAGAGQTGQARQAAEAAHKPKK